MKARLILLAALTACLLHSNVAVGQIERLQTAIIYQLTRLIEWCPSGKHGNFTIGVLCDDYKIMTELNALQGRRVADQTIEVKRISTIQEASSANIVFVSRSRVEDLSAVISVIGSNCTLLIADKPGAAGEGAAISFVEENGRLQFEINKSYAERHSLKVSNDLIKLAKNVF